MIKIDDAGQQKVKITDVPLPGPLAAAMDAAQKAVDAAKDTLEKQGKKPDELPVL